MQKNWKAEDRNRLLLCLVIFGLIAALVILPRQFNSSASSKQVRKGLFQQTKSHEEGLDNYDIRSAEKSTDVADALIKYRQSTGKDAAAVADVRAGFVRGEEALKERIPTVKFEYNEDIRTPEVITPDVWKSNITWLSSSSSLKRSEILRNFVKENNELIGVSDTQADSLKVQADYTNPDGNLSYALLEQFINEVPVFRGEVKAGFTKDGRIIRVINNLAPGLDYGSLSTDFRDPVDAVKSAFSYINREPSHLDVERNAAESTDLKVKFGNGDWATTAEKMYFPTEPGIAIPAWRVLIWQPVNAYYVIVAAEDGRMLWRKNIANDQTQSATYNVFTNNSYIDAADSPNPFSPGPIDPTAGTLQGARITRSTRTLIGNEGALSFNNNGWITDGGNLTDGNAVEAGVDRDSTNGVDAASIPTGSPNRTFNFNFNPGNPVDNTGDSPLPTGAPTGCTATPPAYSDYQKAAATQMFYVMNRYHDELYKRGFTEQARNFQASNFGRGGSENDRVSAEGQDCSGTNNANFATPADGGRGRMQMFLWTGPTPDFDGTIDAEVIIHEVTHGTSNRLHGNGSGLGTNFSGGMGEGWGDFYGYSMLSEPTDPINAVYTTGGYATYLIASGFTANYYYGIRRFPRAPITLLGPNGKPHNPFTFRYLNADCNTLIGTTTSNPPPNSAYPRGPIGVTQCDQVHNVGEVWSSMLWEVRNRMVQRLGHAAGTTRVLQVVTDGMKLAPLNPTFIQERDAIIAGAAALPIAPEASADVSDIREGFRVRGLGFSASIQTTSPIAVTEAFDVPNAIITNPISVSDSTGDNDGFPEPGESILVSVPITNNSGAAINNVTAQVTGGGPAVSYGNIADGQTVTRQLSYTVPANAVCGSLHTVTITGSSALGALNPQTFSFRLGQPVGGAPATFSNAAAITINDNGPASVYPSNITVSGLSGNKVIKLKLNGASHTFPGDIDVLLVGPGGQKFEPMSDQGGGNDIVNINLTLTDTATAALPGTIVTGEFKPTADATTDTFATPAPAGPYNLPAPGGSSTFASVFGTDGATMNGTWSLYIMDDAGVDTGTVAGGWSLTFEANDYTCSIQTPQTAESRADFDNDGKTDISVFRPSEGNWYLNQSTAGFGVVNWGISTDVPVPGDYNGDNKADFAVFRADANAANPDFWILNSGTNTLSGVSWGLPGDVPVIQDYDGDDKEDVAVFRPSTNQWFILKSGGGTTFTTFGQSGDVPVTGDFDGDAKGDVMVYRSGTWIGQLSGGGSVNAVFGSAGDILVPADYDGDNKDDLAVFRPSTGQWIYQPSSGGAAVFTSWGTSGDVPVPGDYDGDGKDDAAIYRNGTWWILRSQAGTQVVNFGLATDKAIPRSYIP